RGHRGPRRAPHAPAAREGARVPDQVSGSRPVRDGRRNDPGRRRGRRRAQARGPLRARLGLLRDHAGDRGRGTHDHGPRPARARPAPDLPRERRGVGARPRARGGKIRPLMKARQLAALLAREISVFLLFAAWAVVVTRPLAFRIATHTLPGPDPLSHLWMVNWLTGHAFQPSQLFHGNIFSPAPHAALMTDLSLGTAVLVLPLRLFVTEPLVLFNLATLIALAFGGWAFHALMFGLTRHRWAGLMAGLLAAFSPEQLAHVFHLNLLSIGWLALFVLGLHRIVERPSVGPVLLTGVSGALNAQSSGYYAVSAAALALVFVAFHARSLRTRRTGGALLAAAGLAALLTFPYIHEFHELRDEQGGLRRPLPMSVQMAFQPGKDLRSTSYVYGRILGAEEGLFPGLLILGLVPVALYRGGRQAWCLATSAAVLVLLSLGPQLTAFGHTLALPYRWLFDIPPFDSMRHPFTFAAVALMLLAVLAGMGFSRLSLA